MRPCRGARQVGAGGGAQSQQGRKGQGTCRGCLQVAACRCSVGCCATLAVVGRGESRYHAWVKGLSVDWLTGKHLLLVSVAAGSYRPPALASAGTTPRTHAAAHQQQLSGPATRTTPRASADGQQQQQQQLPGGTEEDGAFLSPFGSDGYRTGPNTPRSGDVQQPPVGWEGLGPGNKGPSTPGWQGAQQQAGFSGAHAAAGQQHHHEQQQQQQHLGAVPEVEGGGSAGDTWQQLQWQVTLGNSEEWVDAGPVRQLFRKVRPGGASSCVFAQGICSRPSQGSVSKLSQSLSSMQTPASPAAPLCVQG